jgi:6-phosphogluconate dehydrogenase
MEEKAGADVGVIGLAVMGQNLALNMADHGFKVAVFNRTTQVMRGFVAQHPDTPGGLVGCELLTDLVAAVKTPRKIILLVQAGPAVDAVVQQLLDTGIDRDDLVVDCGNSQWTDTIRREHAYAGRCQFFGSGVSGGEVGARFVTHARRQCGGVDAPGADLEGYCRQSGRTEGFQLMRAAQPEYGWELDLATIASIWRGGCIIRARFLQKITDAYRRDPGLVNLLLDPYFNAQLRQGQPQWRTVATLAAQAGIAAPACMAALAYYDGYRSAWLPANLVQAQRDYFGAHTYERTDQPRGSFFHLDWPAPGRPQRGIPTSRPSTAR